jgi:hypothetical protein
VTGDEKHARNRELTRKPCACEGQCGTNHNSGRGGPCQRDPSHTEPNIAAPPEMMQLIGPVNPGTVLITWCPDCHSKGVKLARAAREAALKAELEEAQESLF